MIKAIFALSFAFTCTAFAKPADWRIVEKGDEFVLVHEGGNASSWPLTAEGRAPKLLGWKKAGRSGAGVVIYEAGVAGTSALYRVERAVVVSAKGTVLGEAPWRYVSEAGAPALAQPRWRWTATSVEIADVEFQQRYRFSW